MIRTIFLWSFLSLSLLCAADRPSLQTQVEQALHVSALQHAQVALYAKTAGSDQPLVDVHSAYALAPASGLKLLITAAALELLGPDYRFFTRLYYSGSLDGKGTLRGNIYIRGGGDPTLGSDMVKGSAGLDSLMQTWVNAIRQAGIKRINGRIVADAQLFERESVPDNWVWVDLGNYYGAGVSALTIHDNLYRLYFKPGRQSGDPAQILRTQPAVPGLIFRNRMRTGKKGSGDNGYIYRAPGCFKAETRGTIPAGVDSFSIKGSLPQPALFAARYLTRQLQWAGVSVRDSAEQAETVPNYNALTLLHTTPSPRLADIIYMLNKRSVNLYAEMLLRALPVAQGERGSLSAGLRSLRAFLDARRITDSGYHQEDGSGLSRNNRLTPRMMARLLDYMRQSPRFTFFYRSLAVAGNAQDPGYFRRFGAGTILANNCRIKSGLIQDVRSFSGYLTNARGKQIMFSFLVNNFNGPYKNVDAVFKEILLKLAE